MSSVWKTARAVVEALEPRALCSASALSITEAHVFGGTQLRIEGTPGNDNIAVAQTDAGLLVSNGGWSQAVPGRFQSILIDGGAGNDAIRVDPSVQTDCILYGGPGNNTLVGGSGNDRLYSGAGRNLLEAGSGDEMLVSIGSIADTLIGGPGRDSFWTDASPRQKIFNLRADEIAAGNVHRAASFYAPGLRRHGASNSRAMRVRRLPEPATTDGSSYQDFSSHPLFGPGGPSPDDVFQGDVGDCYYLATLSAVAKADPAKLRQSVLDMGDGTYLVQFSRGNGKVFVRVDGKLPVLPGGAPAYAGLGAGSSLWVAIMEKAYAILHGPTPSYGSIDGGWMDEAFSALGARGQSLAASNPSDLLVQIERELSAGRSVTYAAGTPADGAPLLEQHAYSVDSILLDPDGNAIGLRLRNPWGVAGTGDAGSNNGYVTLTPRQAYDSMLGVVSALV